MLQWLTFLDNSSPNPVDEFGQLPDRFELEQNYPNPFNPTTTISYSLGRRSHVGLKVYDILGREVQTLVNKELGAGYHEIIFDASTLGNGVYFYRMETGNFSKTKKLILLK